MKEDRMTKRTSHAPPHLWQAKYNNLTEFPASVADLPLETLLLDTPLTCFLALAGSPPRDVTTLLTLSVLILAGTHQSRCAS